MGGQADVWREFGKGWATETVVASQLFADKVRILRATRKATSRLALDGAGLGTRDDRHSCHWVAGVLRSAAGEESVTGAKVNLVIQCRCRA